MSPLIPVGATTKPLKGYDMQDNSQLSKGFEQPSTK